MRIYRILFVLVILTLPAGQPGAELPSVALFGEDLHPVGTGPWVLRTLDTRTVLGVLFDREGAEARPTEGDDVVMLLANGADGHSLRARIAHIATVKAEELAWMGMPTRRLVRGQSGHVRRKEGPDYVRFYCFWSFEVIEEPPCTGTVHVRTHVPGGRGLVLHGWTDAPLVDRGEAACGNRGWVRPKPTPVVCPAPKVTLPPPTDGTP